MEKNIVLVLPDFNPGSYSNFRILDTLRSRTGLRLDRVYVYNFGSGLTDEQEEIKAKEEVLETYNNIETVSSRDVAYEELMKVAETLGLDVGEDSDFAKLADGRREAAAKDLFDNKGEGYTLETLQATFDEIVATRKVFEESVELFKTGAQDRPLEDIKYITMLIDQLEKVEHHTIHSGKNIEDVLLPELKQMRDDFNFLKDKTVNKKKKKKVDAQVYVLSKSTIIKFKLNCYKKCT